MDSATSAAPRTSTLRWYPADAGSTYVDTTLTFSVSGTPTTATYYSDKDPTCPASISVDGAILHFQTADGAFNEAFSGSVMNFVGITFSGFPSGNFAGTYDIGAVTKHFKQPRVWVEASLSGGPGWITAWDTPNATTQSVQIATWVSVNTPNAAGAGAPNLGTAGSPGSGGGSGEGGSAGSAGTDTGP